MKNQIHRKIDIQIDSSLKIELLADRFIKELKKAGYTPFEMVRVLKMARLKYEYLKYKNMSKFLLTINQLQEQSDKYQAQLAALEIDESYKDFEENRTLLRTFYKEKISEFTAEINKFKAVENV
ncbi:MAG: hypothetical protein WC389_00035 [Lutibacter sp.]|jgi:hypothetical protein